MCDYFSDYKITNSNNIDKLKKLESWELAIGLNEVDNLKPSEYLIELIKDSIDNNKTYKKDQINRYALKKLMEDFIANNRNHSMKEFKKILQEEFKLALEKEEKTDKEIIKRFKNLLKHYRKNKQDAFAYLR